MNRNTIGVAVIALLAVAVAGGVIVARQSAPDTSVTAPSVRVEADKANGDTKVEAPFTEVEKNEDGVRVQAPGVDVKVPKSTE